MSSYAGNFLVFLALCLTTAAEPMPTPRLSEGVKVSPTIVIAKYKSLQAGKHAYFGVSKANYQIVRALKGKAAPNSALVLDYVFHDNSPCLEPTGWVFRADMMPKVGSQWILLLEPPTTYRGDFGRLPATQENISKVEALLGIKHAR